ncbi:MAG: helix-turn-helix transcriptional regulator [Sphingomonadales bacterium]|nr:helix-turn-helix transcriptional regulator [Sphingomonadales bacterium]
MTPFGKELRRIRLDLEILAGEMAKSLGVSSSYLSQIEFGKNQYRTALLIKFAVFMRCCLKRRFHSISKRHSQCRNTVFG